MPPAEYTSSAAEDVLDLIARTTGENGIDAANVINLGSEFGATKGQLHITGPVSDYLMRNDSV